MHSKINGEFRFSKTLLTGKDIYLTVYINYSSKSYDIVQNSEEGIFPRNNNRNTNINRAYFELALEALDFIDSELYGC